MMISRTPRRTVSESKQVNFWTSYSDLMAGMLLVFTLLLVVAMSHYAEFNRMKREELKQQELKLVAFHKIQQRLIASLEEAFESERAMVDPNTGVLQIGSGILFGEGEAELRPEAITRLNTLFDAYIQVVLANDFRDFIKQIEIEGHTNSNGPYLFNLELSQKRALAVMKALLQKANGANHERLQRMVIASGRSFSQLIRTQSGAEDAVRSRRIEIKFRLKEAEMFSDIYRDLAETP